MTTSKSVCFISGGEEGGGSEGGLDSIFFGFDEGVGENQKMVERE